MSDSRPRPAMIMRVGGENIRRENRFPPSPPPRLLSRRRQQRLISGQSGPLLLSSLPRLLSPAFLLPHSVRRGRLLPTTHHRCRLIWMIASRLNDLQGDRLRLLLRQPRAADKVVQIASSAEPVKAAVAAAAGGEGDRRRKKADVMRGWHCLMAGSMMMNNLL